MDVSAMGERACAPALLWVRRRVRLSPREASFAVRGFHRGPPPVRAELEDVGRTFVAGYDAGLLEDAPLRIMAAVGRHPPRLQGFAAEGAAMGAAVADALTLSTRRFEGWLMIGRGSFDYLIHVGAGWAIARLPWRRNVLLKALDPIHRWLAYDGMGFHDTYFVPRRVLAGWRRPLKGYAAAAYEQGVGRALWFAGCGDLEWIAERINEAPGWRQGHLWSGLGLAISYAGGAADSDLDAARQLSGRYAAHLGQGAIFALAAHAQAGERPEHVERSVARLTGLEARCGVELAARARNELPPFDVDGVPRYELWRAAVREALIPGPRGAALC